MLYVILGNTLSGKTTLARDLRTVTGVKQIITYTNRPMRDGEVDGVDYHFVSTEEIEKEDYFGKRYFYTNYRDKPFIYAMKKEDFVLFDDTIIISDPRGLREIKNLIGYQQVVSVFVDIPEKRILERAKKRGDSIDEVQRRLSVDHDDFASARYWADISINPDNEDILNLLFMKLKGKI